MEKSTYVGGYNSRRPLTAENAVDSDKEEALPRCTQYRCQGCDSLLTWDALALNCLCVDACYAGAYRNFS